MLRAVLDVNVFISYLLTPFSSGAPSEVVLRALNEEFTVLISELLLAELQGIGTSSPYVRQRVIPAVLDEFLEQLLEIGEQVDITGQRTWLSLSDPDDAYLLEMAVLGDADWLVTGDKGVLAANEWLPDVAIVSPAAFLAVLHNSK